MVMYWGYNLEDNTPNRTITMAEWMQKLKLDADSDVDVIKFMDEIWTYDYYVEGVKIPNMDNLKLKFFYSYFDLDIGGGIYGSSQSTVNFKRKLKRYVMNMESEYLAKAKTLDFNWDEFTSRTTQSDIKRTNTSDDKELVTGVSSTDQTTQNRGDTSTTNNDLTNSVRTDDTKQEVKSTGETNDIATYGKGTNVSDTGKVTQNSASANGIGTITTDPIGTGGNSLPLANLDYSSQVDSSQTGIDATDTNNNSTQTTSGQDKNTTEIDRLDSSTNTGTTSTNDTREGNSKTTNNTDQTLNSEAKNDSTILTNRDGKNDEKSTYTTTGGSVPKVDLARKYMSLFINIDLEFVKGARQLFSMLYTR